MCTLQLYDKTHFPPTSKAGVTARTAADRPGLCRTEFIPIEWHTCVHSEELALCRSIENVSTGLLVIDVYLISLSIIYGCMVPALIVVFV